MEAGDFLMRDLVVGEVLNRSTMDWLRAIRALIEEEQARLSPNNALVDVLCDVVRFYREMMWRLEREEENERNLMVRIEGLQALMSAQNKNKLIFDLDRKLHNQRRQIIALQDKLGRLEARGK